MSTINLLTNTVFKIPQRYATIIYRNAMFILPLNINEGVGFAAIGVNVIVVDVYRAYTVKV